MRRVNLTALSDKEWVTKLAESFERAASTSLPPKIITAKILGKVPHTFSYSSKEWYATEAKKLKDWLICL